MSSAAPWPEQEARRVQGSSHSENKYFKERQNDLHKSTEKIQQMNNALLILHQITYAAPYS